MAEDAAVLLARSAVSSAQDIEDFDGLGRVEWKRWLGLGKRRQLEPVGLLVCLAARELAARW